MVDAFGDRVVGEMYLSVFEVFRSVGLGAETNVSFLIEPNSQRLEVSLKHPLPDIELFFTNNQWPLDVLLNHPRNLAPHNVLQDLVEIVEGLDPSPSRHTRRLDNPNVITVQRPLLVYAFKLFEHIICFFQQLLLEYLLSLGSVLPALYEIPLIHRYYQGFALDNTVYLFLKGHQLPGQYLQSQLDNLNLFLIDHTLVLYKLPKNALYFGYLKILIEIFELSNVVDVVAPWKEYIWIPSKQ